MTYQMDPIVLLVRVIGVVMHSCILVNFAVRYKPSGVWHVLRGMGWSCQKPERRARERNEQAIATWRHEDWPHIKKRPKKRAKHPVSG